ncbi:peptide chain release factor N(5)-glutamine methyltransferase, partial [Patescibacteria group bacterium]|nr:peptide chain release factor N(5)-glutamine methyltransferase [Patescibacteria group bacterium]
MSGKNITSKLRISEILDRSLLPCLDAEVLLSHILNKSKEWIFTRPNEIISGKKLSEFRALEKKRAAGISVAALTNSKEFFGLDFFVNSAVLVPRPETELLVEEILKLQPRSLLDVGCGSGCIAIAVKKNLPKCEVSASDVSAAALAVARKNSKKNRAAVKFFCSDLFEKIPSRKFEIIAANLPYIAENSKAVDAGVKKFEPRLALFGGADGLDLIRKLLAQISNLVEKPDFVLLEFGGGRQTRKLREVAKKIFPNAEIEIKKDLAGISRVMKLEG